MLSKRLMSVAVTGGLSSGKTTVCKLFAELGAYVVSADVLVHQLLESRRDIKEQVIALFGDEIVVAGCISRSKVAEKAFQQPALLHLLESVLHPAVQEEIKRHFHYAEQSSYPLFVAEIPLLFESGADKIFKSTVAVTASTACCLKRYIATGGLERDFSLRMARQLCPQAKAEKADYVITNDGTIDDMKASVANIYAEMLSTPSKGV